MSTHESYVSLETAKLLKEAGFDWEEHYPRNFCYVNDSPELFDKSVLKNYMEKDDVIYLAPTLEVAQRWLREVKNCQMEVSYMYDSYGITLCKYIGIYTIQDKRHEFLADEEAEGTIKLVDNYEIAQEDMIKKCLTILLEEKL